ncbi:MAG TPA: endonuclease NucS domain-containing protein [Candidatus Baltobacteraceae bacterium]|nr:endonuclease NucS domain-containing protein [Candidatus Baltobacteraceae bacterium]
MANDKSVRELLREFAASKKPGEVFTRSDIRDWFQEYHPAAQLQTVDRQTTALTTNIESRRFWYPKPGRDDVFYRLRPYAGDLRLFDVATDPPPIYATNALDDLTDGVEEEDESEALQRADGMTFALENHLRDFLAKNVSLIEPGMKLFTEIEGIDGVEVPMGGNRSADLVTVDAGGNLVVVELKVSRGHEKTVGQLLRYVGFTAREYAKGRKVRGIIVASELSSDLCLAVEPLRPALDVRLMKYKLTFEMSHDA